MLLSEIGKKTNMVEMVMGSLDVDKTLSNDPIRRLCALVDCSRPHGVSSNVPLERVCKILNEMYEMAGVYKREGKMEKAFILYLRFVGIVVEELPKHKDYDRFTPSEKENYDRQSIRAMNSAELLKRQIKNIYEKEAEELAINSNKNLNSMYDTNINSMPIIPFELNLNFKPYALCKKLTNWNLLFQRIILPNDLPEKFIKILKTDENHKFAILYGKLLRNSLIISHLLFINDKSPPLDHLDKCITDPSVRDPSESNELMIVGFICGSLCNDVLDYFISKLLLTEIAIVVCNNGDGQTYVLHLSNLPEKKIGDVCFSDSSKNPPSEIEINEHDPCKNICCHTHISATLSCTILNLENDQLNMFNNYSNYQKSESENKS